MMIQITDSIFHLAVFLQFLASSSGIPLRNQDDELKNICINLFGDSQHGPEFPSKDHLVQSRIPQHKSLRGNYPDKPKVSVSRINTVGRGGQISQYNLIGTDQATNTGGNIVTTQQNINLIDSIAKYVEASIILTANLKRNNGSNEHSGMLKSKDFPLQSESLESKCKKFLTMEKISSQSQGIHRTPQSSKKNAREFSPQESKGTEILANVGIGPDGDYTDVVSSATDNSTVDGSLFGQFDQSHFKLERSSADFLKITSATSL
ncbi:uncharacterized protein LOC141850072 [Brevipalpus obovatus]|uniref:uncharacterized protein LOC141850072 n=1 Tax=Brevipalpus obovatus TaxID=246614 RepID=UPI003D9F5D9B